MLGIKHKTFLNTGSYGSPAFFVIPSISDESVNTTHDEASLDRRAGPTCEYEPTVKRGELSVKVLKETADARWQAMSAAFWSRAAVDVLALGCGVATFANGLLDLANSPDSTGVRFSGRIFAFNEGRNLNDGIFNDTTIKPGWNSRYVIATLTSGSLTYATPGSSASPPPPPPPPPAPVASFSADPTSGFDPLGVSFTDTSTNTPTSWLWERSPGDGWDTFSASQNPVADFAEGTWSIRLTATNASGSDSHTETDLIESAPLPPLSTPSISASTPGPTTIDVEVTFDGGADGVTVNLNTDAGGGTPGDFLGSLEANAGNNWSVSFGGGEGVEPETDYYIDAYGTRGGDQSSTSDPELVTTPGA